MDYCGPKGIPLHEFLSWPQESQDAALAWQVHNARRCGQCGTHLDDWKPSEGGDRHAYHAEYYTCPGCQKLHRLQESPEVAKASPGIHVRLAAGPQTSCPRCAQPSGGDPGDHQNAAIQDRNGHRRPPSESGGGR